MAKSVAITDNASHPAHSEGDNQVEASCRVLVVTVVAVIVVRILSTLAKLISSVRPKHGNRTSCLHTNERELRRRKKIRQSQHKVRESIPAPSRKMHLFLSPPPSQDSYHYLLLAIRYKTRRVDCTDGDEHLPFTPLPLPSVALPQKGMGIARRHHFRDRRSTLGAGIYWHGNNGPNPSVIKICARAKLFPVCFFFLSFLLCRKNFRPKTLQRTNRVSVSGKTKKLSNERLRSLFPFSSSSIGSLPGREPFGPL